MDSWSLANEEGIERKDNLAQAELRNAEKSIPEEEVTRKSTRIVIWVIRVINTDVHDKIRIMKITISLPANTRRRMLFDK